MDVCIYGVGRYGISTYYKLLERGIKICCFGDQSIEKQGYIVNDIKCVSFEEVMQLDRRTTVIVVAIKKNNQQLVDLFRKSGFKYVCSYNELKEKKGSNAVPPLTDIKQIQCEKKFIEQVVLKDNIDNKVYVSNDLKDMVNALRKRGKYEGIRG